MPSTRSTKSSSATTLPEVNDNAVTGDVAESNLSNPISEVIPTQSPIEQSQSCDNQTSDGTRQELAEIKDLLSQFMLSQTEFLKTLVIQHRDGLPGGSSNLNQSLCDSQVRSQIGHNDHIASVSQNQNLVGSICVSQVRSQIGQVDHIASVSQNQNPVGSIRDSQVRPQTVQVEQPANVSQNPNRVGSLRDSQVRSQTGFTDQSHGVDPPVRCNVGAESPPMPVHFQDSDVRANRDTDSRSHFGHADQNSPHQSRQNFSDPGGLRRGLRNSGRDVSPTHQTPSGANPWTDYCPYFQYAQLPMQQTVLNQICPPDFHGDKSKAREWLRDYEAAMRINNYTNEQRLERASAYLKGPAKDWFYGTSRLHQDLDWYSFKNRFLKHFCGADGRDQLRKKLEESRQKHDEHPSEYMMRIMSLCTQYDPDMSNEELVRRIARGLSTDIVNMLSISKQQNQWTLNWLNSVFDEYKLGRPKDSDTTKSSRRSTSTRPASPNAKPRDLSTWMCFNCGEKGHLIVDCPKPRNEEQVKKRTEAFKEERKRSKDAPKRQTNSVAEETSPKASLPCDEVRKLMLSVDINGKKLLGRIDTGADMTVIPDDVAFDLNLTILEWDQPNLKAANKSDIKMVGMSPVLATINNVRRTLLVAVVPRDALTQTLWGTDLLKLFSLQLDYGSRDPSIQLATDQERLVCDATAAPHPLDKVKFGDLKSDDRLQFREPLIQYQDTFSTDDQDRGCATIIKHRVILKDDVPVCSPPYRTPFRNRETLEAMVKKNVDSGAWRPSISPYASPVFFVDKDHGAGKRLVADYRALNAKTVLDKTPMPHPEDVFGMLAGMTTFAKLDITAMFNQIKVDERDIEKTAVTTPFGLYECPVMPFGLVNAPATAVRLMKEVLRDLNGRICYVYFDDIIIFATNVAELVQRCTKVLARLREHNLKLNPSKCIFGASKVNFLGHVITASGVEIDSRRIECVKNFPTPRNPSDVRSFHGLCSYNRKFIQNFAHIAKPLTPLMGKPTDFQWTTEAQVAFENLRDALTKAPVLVHFDPEAQHELRTDASSHAIGAILYQKHDEKDRTGIVLYFSRTLNQAQRNYSATERELLAAFTAIMELKHYLYGKRFTLITDHAALSLLRNHKDPHHRLARWVAQLQPYEFDVEYKPGAKNVDADCMSRFIREIPSETPHQLIQIVRIISQASSEEGSQTISSLDPNDLADFGNLGEPSEEDTPQVDLKAEQREDDYFMKYIRVLESDSSDEEKSRQARGFTLQDDLLYRVKGEDKFLLCIPPRRRAAVLLACHDAPLAGHLGFSRVYSFIKSRYFWPKMRRDIKKYVISCPKCQKRKVQNKRTQGYIHPLPIAENIFDIIGIDLITKLPRTYNGYNTILVCTDNLSKFVVTAPLRNETAPAIIHAFFNHVVAVHGCPKLVISDRGPNISGEESRDFFRLFGIKRNLTSSYHPQSNGQTERFNRTLAASLTMFVEKNQRDWSDFLQAMTFAYNISEHSVTRATPFELVFGRRPRIPLDNLLNREDFIDPTRPEPGMLSSAAVNLMKELITQNQQKNKRRLDARLAPSTFNEGDLVVVERPTRIKGTAGKLTYSHVGPYRIRRKISDLSFEIANIKGRAGVSVIHPCHLRKFIPRECDVADPIIRPDFVPRENVDTRDRDSETETVSADEREDEDIESPQFEPLTPQRPSHPLEASS